MSSAVLSLGGIEAMFLNACVSAFYGHWAGIGVFNAITLYVVRVIFKLENCEIYFLAQVSVHKD